MTQYALKPQASDQRNVSQGDILNNFTYLQTTMGVDHYFSNDTTTSQNGMHNQVSFISEAAPAIGAADSQVYSQSGVLRFQNSTVSAQISPTTSPSVAANGYSYMAGGALVQWGTATMLISTQTKAVTFPIAFPTGVYSVVTTPQGSTSTTGVSNWGTSNITTAGFNARNYNKVVDAATTFSWMAIGR